MSKPSLESATRARLVRAAVLTACGVATALLGACKLAGPPPTEYVLGSTAEPATASQQATTGLPVVVVRRVQVPDYLDRTAMVERRGNELVPSATSRWGERLSVGMTRALASSLAVHLPGMVVTTRPPLGHPARQLYVDVITFESQQQRVVLVARWRITDGSGQQVLMSEQGSFVETIAGDDGGAVATAMSQAVEGLAGQVATGMEEKGRVAAGGEDSRAG
jgi:uncharacterized lipoprotein YmbA